MLLGKLFEHPGFKYLLEWAKAQEAEAHQRVLFAQSWDQHVFNRGAQLSYQNIVNLEQLTEAEFEAIANEALDAANANAEDLTDE